MGQVTGDCKRTRCKRMISGNRLLDLTTEQIHVRKELLLIFSCYIGSRISQKEVEMFIKRWNVA
jgi:hypothetical protein